MKISKTELGIALTENISSLPAYPAGKPIEETKREFGLSEVIKLASNENPLGPSPKALEAIQKNSAGFHLYPDPAQYELKKALALSNQCLSENIVVGCGSNEIIDFLMRVLGSTKKNIVSPKFSFIAYRLCAQLSGLSYLESDVDSKYQTQVDSILKTVNEETAFVILANPNNPTGTFLKKEEVEYLAGSLLKKNVYLVLDYAYWEYVTDPSIPSPNEMIQKFSNLIVLKTFSKIYGLAALRVGYLIAQTPVAKAVEKARQPFNVSLPALLAAEAALTDIEHLQKSQLLNKKSKEELLKYLAEFSTLEIAEGQGNFLFIDFKRPVSEIYTELLKQGVIVRPLANYGLPNHFRITLGNSSENLKLKNALKKVLK